MRNKIYKEDIIKICSRKHYTAREVFDLLQKKYPTVGQATIYRTLHNLVSEGSLCEIKGLGESNCYESFVKWHGHIIDQKTGKVQDLVLPVDLLDKIKLPKKFKAKEIDIKIYGSF